MFFDVFTKLCDKKGISPTRASIDIGFSKGSVSYWRKKYKEGIDAKPDTYTAQKIADYFDVSIDYLLGRTDNPTDYENGDLIAAQAGQVLDHFNGDVKSAVEFQHAVAEDVAKERRAMPEIYRLYLLLDEIDQAKAEAYVSGLLAADKYQSAREKNA